MAKRTGPKKLGGGGAPKYSTPSTAQAWQSDGHFYGLHSFSAHFGASKQPQRWPQNTPSGRLGLSWVPFGADLPRKAHPQNSSRSLGRCGHLDGPHWCRQKPLWGWHKWPVWSQPLFGCSIKNIICILLVKKILGNMWNRASKMI